MDAPGVSLFLSNVTGGFPVVVARFNSVSWGIGYLLTILHWTAWDHLILDLGTLEYKSILKFMHFYMQYLELHFLEKNDCVIVLKNIGNSSYILKINK